MYERTYIFFLLGTFFFSVRMILTHRLKQASVSKASISESCGEQRRRSVITKVVAINFDEPPISRSLLLHLSERPFHFLPVLSRPTKGQGKKNYMNMNLSRVPSISTWIRNILSFRFFQPSRTVTSTLPSDRHSTCPVPRWTLHLTAI